MAALAGRVGVSRAALARRFNDVVGEPPMAYLTGWRLALAADLLLEPGASVGAVSRRVGYGSPFTFSTAFKRAYGHSPKAHRTPPRERTAPPARPGGQDVGQQVGQRRAVPPVRVLARVVAAEREADHRRVLDDRAQHVGQLVEVEAVGHQVVRRREDRLVQHVDVEVHPVDRRRGGARRRSAPPRPVRRRRVGDDGVAVLLPDAEPLGQVAEVGRLVRVPRADDDGITRATTGFGPMSRSRSGQPSPSSAPTGMSAASPVGDVRWS